ncbi:MAG: hypothetical protein WAM05_16375 [Candidatus Binataceae bacterium]
MKVGGANEYRNLSQAPDRHFERCARNPEASMLDANLSCSGPSIGISFGLAQDRLSRGSRSLP